MYSDVLSHDSLRKSPQQKIIEMTFIASEGENSSLDFDISHLQASFKNS